jgi:hypothetical protein
VSPMGISWIVFACVFGGALLGMFLRTILPENYLSANSELIRLGTNLITTMSALVLGLLIASAKSSHDAQGSEFAQLTASYVQLDRILAHYGPETNEIRDFLRRTIVREFIRTPPTYTESKTLNSTETRAEIQELFDRIDELSPKNNAQRSLRAQAVRIGFDLGQTRLLLLQRTETSVPMPFLVVLVFWLSILLISFGLFSPPNSIAIVVLFVCAVTVSAAIFLILDLDQPFNGLMHISTTPLSNALAHPRP